MNLVLGCIADDFTGATDLANQLVRGGMRTVQTIGVPAAGDEVNADAIVIALKSRTAPVDDAVRESLAAASWLRERGAAQVYFKICSTFDSTPRGNIGPVGLALADALDARLVPVTPAFPEGGRTVFNGHLFVGEALLSDSPMRHHPLTPMTDANLVRVLQAQLPASERVGLVGHRVLRGGADALRSRLDALCREGSRFAIVDATGDEDLRALAEATRSFPLVIGGSGLAAGIPMQHGFEAGRGADTLPPPRGTRAVVSGSCSAATNAQVAAFVAAGGPAFAIDPLQLAAGRDLAREALDWARAKLSPTLPVLVYATAAPDAVQAVQRALGTEQAGALVEDALARVALGLVQAGAGQLIVAGGETSGACVRALGVARLSIGAQIDTGVPWCHAKPASAPEGLHLALKSGNFGGTRFFVDAFERLS